MLEQICQSHASGGYLLAAIVLNEALEFWLGKTDKFAEGSKLELILSVLKRIKKGD